MNYNVTLISMTKLPLTEKNMKMSAFFVLGLTGYSSTFYRNISSFFPKYLILNGWVFIGICLTSTGTLTQ